MTTLRNYFSILDGGRISWTTQCQLPALVKNSSDGFHSSIVQDRRTTSSRVLTSSTRMSTVFPLPWAPTHAFPASPVSLTQFSPSLKNGGSAIASRIRSAQVAEPATAHQLENSPAYQAPPPACQCCIVKIMPPNVLCSFVLVYTSALRAEHGVTPLFFSPFQAQPSRGNTPCQD